MQKKDFDAQFSHSPEMGFFLHLRRLWKSKKKLLPELCESVHQSPFF
jgi:hypothetical protein